MNKFNRQNGFSQIILLIIISFLAIALPITTKLVQKSQENRSSAATLCMNYGQGQCGSISGCRWDSRNHACVSSANKYARGLCNQITGLYSCAVSSSGAYSTYEACVGTSTDNTCIKVPPTSTPPKAATCSSSNCGVCTLATSCSAYGCYWDDTKSPKCSSTLPAKDGKQCMDNYSKYHKSGSMSCGVNSGKKDYSYYCNDGKWGGGVDCGSYGCNPSTGSCNTAVANETYYFGGSCTSGSYSTRTICESKNGTCYSTSADCRNAHPCTYASTSIPLGSSQCFNAFWGAYSDLVRCDSVNGKSKPFIVKSFKKANCEGVDVKGDASGLGCAYGGTTLVNGQHQCFNVFMKSGVAIGSVMIACDNGVHRTEARYPRQNCVEGNRKADEVDTTEDKEDVDTPAAEEEDGTTTPNDTLSKFYYGSNCVEGNYKSYNDCVSKTGQTCYVNKDVCLSVYSIKYNLYSKASETCDSSTGNWKCTYIVNSSRPGDGITTFTDKSACEGASGCEKSDPDDGEHGSGLTTICTANTVSTTDCYDTTHLNKCNSEGTAWIQGDQCATGQVCSNGVCGVGTTGASKLSFKIAFDGVAAANIKCFDNFKTVTLTVGKVGTTLTQQLSVGVSKTDLTTSKNYAIFEADNVALGTGFSGVTNVYARIKGQVHARMYYCVKSQSAKNTSEICNLSLDGTVNNFYEYPILGGDVNQDGIVNTSDFTVIKNALFTTGCGVKSDLNGDSIVNEFDYKIFKVALEAKYDE